MKTVGVMSRGIVCPIIKKGDSLSNIILDSLKNAINDEGFKLQDRDVICITESIVARAQGNYCTIDDMVESISRIVGNKKIGLYYPIMSRNRFSLILRAFARYATDLVILIDADNDEQGNPTQKINPFTRVNIQEYYSEICKEENCNIVFELGTVSNLDHYINTLGYSLVDARCHQDSPASDITLKDIMSKPINGSGYNSEYGVLGSNKATEDTLKLFPRDCNDLCQIIQNLIADEYGVIPEVLVYGDGCFKDPVGGIWEFADPVTCPGYTSGLSGTPNEIKMKYFADNKLKGLKGEELQKAMKSEIKSKEKDLVGKMESQGTTPRRYIDLLASLADLTSGSGDKGTPIVLIQNYFKNYAED